MASKVLKTLVEILSKQTISEEECALFLSRVKGKAVTYYKGIKLDIDFNELPLDFSKFLMTYPNFDTEILEHLHKISQE